MVDNLKILADYRSRVAAAKHFAIGGVLTAFDLSVVVKRTARACDCAPEDVLRVAIGAKDPKAPAEVAQ